MRKAGLIVSEKIEGEMLLRTKYTPYCLRHYQASKLIEKNEDAKYIQSFTGHSDIKITYNTDGHLMKDREDEHKKTAQEIAADLIGFERRSQTRRYRAEYRNPKPLERTQNWIKFGGKVTAYGAKRAAVAEIAERLQ